ncbi:MAG: hypothetical protein J6M27_15270 [Lachnospiraceae bacterium]|nr:hypothetical protein [Lachnospiraceae bacterium]MBP3297935.1 hypothetical protein [Lachnospiraceae bacterium]
MTTSEVVGYVKKAMRISHTSLDDTIAADVDAGALDAFERGVSVFAEADSGIRDDKLVLQLLVLYCQGKEDYNGKGDTYKRDYEALCDSMSMYAGYKADAR